MNFLLDADAVSPVHNGLPLDQAGAMPIVALTVWQGLVRELERFPDDLSRGGIPTDALI